MTVNEIESIGSIIFEDGELKFSVEWKYPSGTSSEESFPGLKNAFALQDYITEVEEFYYEEIAEGDIEMEESLEDEVSNTLDTTNVDFIVDLLHDFDADEFNCYRAFFPLMEAADGYREKYRHMYFQFMIRDRADLDYDS